MTLFQGIQVPFERLLSSGKLDSFDEAVKKGDVDKAIKILKSVDLDKEAIDQVLEKLKLVS